MHEKVGPTDLQLVTLVLQALQVWAMTYQLL